MPFLDSSAMTEVANHKCFEGSSRCRLTRFGGRINAGGKLPEQHRIGHRCVRALAGSPSRLKSAKRTIRQSDFSYAR